MKPIFRLVALAAAVTLAPVASARHAPPDAERAPATLAASPRHAEWVDVPLAASAAPDAKPGAGIKTWVVYPERKDKAPVVIVIHEIFGLTDWIRATADALAAEGYIAVAPDLLSGMGPEGGGTESFVGDAVREAIRGLTPEETARRLDAVRAWALAQPAASGKSGSVGFCWGGSASFNYAGAQPALNAAIVYYGSAPTDAAKLKKIECPVLGLYGGDDARVTSTVDATKQAMRDANKDFTPLTYDGAGHGFLRQQTGRDGANAKAAEAAWRETLTFLQKHLSTKE